MKTIAGAAPGWMLVHVAGVEIALPIESVGEVLPMPELAAVPMAPRWVAGIVSVRDEVVPVVELGMRLFGRASTGERRMVIATTSDGERVGLVVDTIAGLIDRSEARAAAPGSTETGALPDRFATGAVAAGDDAPVGILDLRATLDPAIESA
jgi:purine-binding chemotaxis protein CheW